MGSFGTACYPSETPAHHASKQPVLLADWLNSATEIPGSRVFKKGMMIFLTSMPQKAVKPVQDPLPVKVEVTDPSLKAWGEQAKKLMIEWYPKIETILGVAHEAHPEQVELQIDTHGSGVAGTGGRHIEVNGDYVRKNPKDIGLVVHELAHVVQSYPHYNPSWLVEGIADYVRWFNYEPVSKRPHPNPDRIKYTSGYQGVAAFLNWAANRYNPNLVRVLNQSLTLDHYADDPWKYATSFTFDELWNEYVSQLKSEKSAQKAG